MNIFLLKLKYLINYMNNPKPVETIKEIIEIVHNDVQEIKKDLVHIKEYIRKLEIRKQIEEQEAQRQENEYVIEKKGWWW
jgi:hypothetical protein